IVLGPVTRRMSGDDGICNYFTAGNGDVVRFTRRRSRGSWPMPWEWFRIMGAGRKRGRFVYHRFTWANPTGQQLTLSWRDEQWLYRGAREWIDAYIERIVEMRISKARS
ncbi:MAG TPA: hypothetical protein VLI90_15050, partial [Tepidisphaeraceae bacterium]|nr:hypothetical protein [Tepidisphaeraceae bacterium]